MVTTKKTEKMIRDFLDCPLPLNWDDYDLEDRRAYWRSERKAGSLPRTRVCAIEIWQELFEGKAAEFNLSIAREINAMVKQVPLWRSSTSTDCGPLYGRQRGFVFVGLLDRAIARMRT